MRVLAIAAFALVASGCANPTRGWTGSGAVPFDTAVHYCTVDTATMADRALREAAYANCMAEKGWTQSR